MFVVLNLILFVVHCSVTIVVAYLMMKNGMNLSEALEHVKRKRPVASPNSGFISQLQNFERSLQGTCLFNLELACHTTVFKQGSLFTETF